MYIAKDSDYVWHIFKEKPVFLTTGHWVEEFYHPEKLEPRDLPGHALARSPGDSLYKVLDTHTSYSHDTKESFINYVLRKA